MNAYASMPAAAEQNAQRSIAEMNITPLVDVMLVLLVIFMVAAPIFTQPIPLHLGEAPPLPAPQPLEPIALRIDAAGDVFLNDSAIPKSALLSMLEAEVQRDPQQSPMLKIDASGDADYQAVASVLAVARNAGLQKIGFVR